MAHKVALINMKGGVGKSTLAVNLAWEMATDPWYKSVLVVDLAEIVLMACLHTGMDIEDWLDLGVYNHRCRGC